jgi:hypothetical protein
VPEGQYLLDNVSITTDSKDLKDTDFSVYLRQQPNLKLFKFIPFNLGLYSISSPDTTLWINRFLQKIGDAPVIYDSTLVEASATELKKAMNNKGYLNAEVSHNTTYKKKKAKVGQWSTDPKTLKELEAEDDVALEKDFRKEKAREKENAKYAKVGTLEEFKLNFYNAIKHQVEMVTQEYQSYNEINAEYESEDVIMKADLTQEVPEEAIPIVDVYFDVSGS